MKKISQGESKRLRRQALRAAAPPLLAMNGRCEPGVESETAVHLSVLRDMIPLARLANDHPIRVAWTSPTSFARFQLHHLADDMLAVRRVPGFQSLLKRMVTDQQAYEDYRYELRMAANLARSGSSKVLQLAGDRAGPDIEFVSDNGKACGLACYRARGEAVPIEEVQQRCQAVMTDFLAVFFRHRVGVDIGLEVLFPSFPPTAEDWREASELLTRLWQQSAPPDVVGERGVLVRRCVQISSLRHLGIPRRARVRFLFKIGARERVRVGRHVEQKLAKETSWASTYEGVPLFAYEVSPWTIVPPKEDLAALVAAAGPPFGGVIATGIAFPQNGRVVHSFEDLVAHAPQLHLSFCTYGQNRRGWEGDSPAIWFEPDHACAFWDVWEQGGVAVLAPSKPMGLVRRGRRLADISVKTVADLDRGTIQRLAETAIQVRDEGGNPFEW